MIYVCVNACERRGSPTVCDLLVSHAFVINGNVRHVCDGIFHVKGNVSVIYRMDH
jgi:hypothetical protein